MLGPEGGRMFIEDRQFRFPTPKVVACEISFIDHINQGQVNSIGFPSFKI